MPGNAAHGSLTLVTGGVRSGKSAFAQSLADALGSGVLFVATAEAGDAEMTRRIARHQADRPKGWTTLEVRRGVGDAITAADRPVVLVDCLTLLVSNILCDGFEESGKAMTQLEREVDAEADALIAAAGRSHVVIVSGEVGSGLVPEHAMSRAFRDLLGMANQRLAAAASAAFLLVAGRAVPLHAVAVTPESVARSLTSRSEGRA